MKGTRILRRALDPVVVFAIFLGLVLNVPCLAQDNEPAKAKFMEGLEHVQEGRYPEALEAFEASYNINPKASVLFNIGMCQKALFRYADAIASFEKFLSVAGDDVTPLLKGKSTEALVQLKSLAGRLQIEDAPTGATIVIDGKEAGTTPQSAPTFLDPGAYSLSVSLEGYVPLETQVTIAEGELLTVFAALAPIPPIIEATPVEIFESEESQRDSKHSPPAITGVVLGAAGLASMGVGIYFTVQYQNTVDEMEAAEKGQQTATDQDTHDIHWDTYNDLKDDALPNNKTGMIVSYVVGGTLLLTGATLLVVDLLKRDKTESQSVSVLPTPGGVLVRF